MNHEIHAHKVLNLLREQPMTESEWRDKAHMEFGKEARYCTCKKSGFSFDELLVFLKQRQKINEVNGQWGVNTERLCQH